MSSWRGASDDGEEWGKEDTEDAQHGPEGRRRHADKRQMNVIIMLHAQLEATVGAGSTGPARAAAARMARVAGCAGLPHRPPCAAIAGPGQPPPPPPPPPSQPSVGLLIRAYVVLRLIQVEWQVENRNNKARAQAATVMAAWHATVRPRWRGRALCTPWKHAQPPSGCMKPHFSPPASAFFSFCCSFFCIAGARRAPCPSRTSTACRRSSRPSRRTRRRTWTPRRCPPTSSSGRLLALALLLLLCLGCRSGAQPGSHHSQGGNEY